MAFSTVGARSARRSWSLTAAAGPCHRRPAAQCAIRAGVERQLAFTSTAEYQRVATVQVKEAEQDYFSAVRNAHRSLSASDTLEVKLLMDGDWKDASTFMTQLHPSHAVWRHDENTQMAQNALAVTRAALIAAQIRQRDGTRVVAM